MSQTSMWRRDILVIMPRLPLLMGPMVITTGRQEFVSALRNLAATSVEGAAANDLEGGGYG
jgi:hypothetical protein